MPNIGNLGPNPQGERQITAPGAIGHQRSTESRAIKQPVAPSRDRTNFNEFETEIAPQDAAPKDRKQVDFHAETLSIKVR